MLELSQEVSPPNFPFFWKSLCIHCAFGFHARDTDVEARMLLKINPSFCSLSTFSIHNSTINFSSVKGHKEVCSNVLWKFPFLFIFFFTFGICIRWILPSILGKLQELLLAAAWNSHVDFFEMIFLRNQNRGFRHGVVLILKPCLLGVQVFAQVFAGGVCACRGNVGCMPVLCPQSAYPLLKW